MFLVSNSIIDIPKNHTWIIFSPKDLCLPNQFSRIEEDKYILNLISWKKLGSFNDLIVDTYFQPFIYLPQYWHSWTELSQSWKDLTKTLWSHGNLQSLINVINGANIGTHSSSGECFFFNVHDVKNEFINEQGHAILETCINSILYLLNK